MEFQNFDGLGLADLVRRGQVSALELVDATIADIEKKNPAINAVIYKQYDTARELAKKPLLDGPFCGVPFLFKDLGASEIGVPQTFGSRFCKDFQPGFQSELVRRYYAAGFIPLGRTNTPEFGLLPTTEPKLFGPTRNPWNKDHISGGSSGGAAAAVSSGMVTVAHASDGGGSIRIPASCCGVFGFKPSEGRSPAGPTGRRWHGLAVDHVITRTVRDSAAALDVTCAPQRGEAIHAPFSQTSFHQQMGQPLRQLRIGLIEKPHFGAKLHSDCRDALLDSAKLCESLGHTVEATKLNIDDDAIAQAFLTMLAGETGAAVNELSRILGKSPLLSDLEPLTHVLSLGGKVFTAAEYAKAVQTLDLARLAVAQTFEHFDVILTPTLALPPPQFGQLDLSRVEQAQLNVLRRFPNHSLIRKAFQQLPKTAFAFTPYTFLFNITGQPAMSVPLHWNQKGLPIGSQFVAEFGADGLLLQLARQLEESRPFRRVIL